MARPSLPNTAAISDPGHVTDHNLLTAAVQDLQDYSVEITSPNTDDVKVRVHNGTTWQTIWYDSGWRNISSLVTSGWLGPTDTICQIRRVGTTVHLLMSIDGSVIGAGTGKIFFSFPTGFLPYYGYLPPRYYAVDGTGDYGAVWYNSGGALTVTISTALPANTRMLFTWETQSAYPTSLPGTESSAPLA